MPEYLSARIPMPEYLSARTISAECDVTERTVRYWIADGELPVVRFSPRCVRVPRAEYEAFKLRHFAAVAS
jgi:excisionase family DNA binding protein